jgi:DNA-binding XRE family transcriptional regulator
MARFKRIGRAGFRITCRLYLQAILGHLNLPVKEFFLMGKAKEEKPKRVAEKLRQIRIALNLSQSGMADTLARQGVRIYRGYVGNYETGHSLPSLLILRAYAKIAKVCMDVIVDDELELPAKYK